eukprot:CAMPEP_0171751786 /NCGR_PEP_ID=MMETSP0991-20121206/42220_1 /TAXON_ID=483369 /ORGANISM="non described non described, Strain CCMP2098" /LENGTH=55 /DNA_ID=CAMNT_0012353029 /DNA_START=321 /DNA_END=484 /DNA_ORIENTATION=-
MSSSWSSLSPPPLEEEEEEEEEEETALLFLSSGCILASSLCTCDAHTSTHPLAGS